MLAARSNEPRLWTCWKPRCLSKRVAMLLRMPLLQWISNTPAGSLSRFSDKLSNGRLRHVNIQKQVLRRAGGGCRRDTSCLPPRLGGWQTALHLLSSCTISSRARSLTVFAASRRLRRDSRRYRPGHPCHGHSQHPCLDRNRHPCHGHSQHPYLDRNRHPCLGQNRHHDHPCRVPNLALGQSYRAGWRRARRP